MGDNENFDALLQNVGASLLETHREDAHFSTMKEFNLLKDPAETKAREDSERLNDDMQLESCDTEGSNDCGITTEAANAQPGSSRVGKSVPHAEQPPSQEKIKSEQQNKIEIEGEESKQAEKVLSHQGKDQQNPISSVEDQESTRSTTNAFTSEKQAAKDHGFVEGALTFAPLCLNIEEQGQICAYLILNLCLGEKKINDHHAQVEDDKKDGWMAGFFSEEFFPWMPSDPLYDICTNKFFSFIKEI